MADTTDEADILETATEVAPDATEEVEVPETVDNGFAETQLKERLKKAEEYGRNQKIRAEKAELKAKEVSSDTETIVTPDLSSKDTIALINAKVHEDDVDEVVEYAKFKKISLAEALRTNVIKTSLSERAEQRATAEATTTGKARSGHAKVSGETLLRKAQKTGEMPDRQEDLEALLEERYRTK